MQLSIKTIKFITVLIAFSIVSCHDKNTTNSSESLTESSNINRSKQEITVTISCNKSNIEDYLKAGWQISNKTEREITCSWKTSKSTRNCDLERDKGCKITLPNERGLEITYQLIK